MRWKGQLQQLEQLGQLGQLITLDVPLQISKGFSMWRQSQKASPVSHRQVDHESCHTWKSWVKSHINESRHANESCHTCMSHVTHAWVMSYMNESCHMKMSHGISNVTSPGCPWFMAHKWVMSYTWMRHVKGISTVILPRWPWVMAHIQTSHVTHMNDSCHTYEWVMSKASSMSPR